MKQWKIWLIVAALMIPLVIFWVFSLKTTLDTIQSESGGNLFPNVSNLKELWQNKILPSGRSQLLPNLTEKEIQRLREEVLKKAGE